MDEQWILVVDDRNQPVGFLFKDFANCKEPVFEMLVREPLPASPQVGTTTMSLVAERCAFKWVSSGSSRGENYKPCFGQYLQIVKGEKRLKNLDPREFKFLAESGAVIRPRP